MMNIPKINYETLSEAMNALKKQGFTSEFDFKDASLFNQTNKTELKANQMKIVKFYRFEGMTNPDDSSILYAIVGEDGSKGLLVDAYGMYADADKTAFMKDVEIESE
jgi:hypothetical protein